MKPAPAKLSDPGALPELAWLPVERCHIDRRYQRSLETARSQAHVIAIADNFRWAAFQAVLATEDGEGGWLIIDGQHRCAAARRRGIAHVPAVVVKAASLEEQATAFIAANRQRVPVNQFAVFHSQVASGDALAKHVAAICARCAIVVPRYSAKPLDLPPGATIAVATLLKLVRQRGAAEAALAIGAVADAYRAIPGALRAPFFDGAARYIASWPKAGRHEAGGRAAEYFASHAPDQVFAAMASAVGQAGQLSRGRAIAALIAKEFSVPAKAEPAKAEPAQKARATVAAAHKPAATAAKKIPVAVRGDEDAAIAAFIAKNGVTREVDFGVHQPIVAAARGCAMDCMMAPRHGDKLRWRLNGAEIDTPELYKRVNVLLERRGKKPIAMPDGTKGKLRGDNRNRTGRRRTAA